MKIKGTITTTVNKEQNMEAETALELVQKMDKRMSQFVQYAFKRDWKDASLYDAVLNLDKLSTGWAENIILELAGSDEVKACSLKALEEMELSSLQRKMDAAVIKYIFSTAFSGILVSVTGPGKFHLRGWINTKMKKARL